MNPAPERFWIGRPGSSANWSLFFNSTHALDARSAGWEVREAALIKGNCPVCHGTRCFGKDDPPSLRC